MTDALEFHELANLFPLMDEDSEEFQQIVEDIREYGQREPIILYQGKILDGRTRYRAALAAGMRPLIGRDDLDGWPNGWAKALVLSKNLHRRHLTKEQRAEVIRHLRAQGWTIQSIADKTGTSVGTVHAAITDPNFKSENEEQPPQGVTNSRGQVRPPKYQTRLRMRTGDVKQLSPPQRLRMQVGEANLDAPKQVIVPRIISDPEPPRPVYQVQPVFDDEPTSARERKIATGRAFAAAIREEGDDYADDELRELYADIYEVLKERLRL